MFTQSTAYEYPFYCFNRFDLQFVKKRKNNVKIGMPVRLVAFPLKCIQCNVLYCYSSTKLDKNHIIICPVAKS